MKRQFSLDDKMNNQGSKKSVNVTVVIAAACVAAMIFGVGGFAFGSNYKKTPVKNNSSLTASLTGEDKPAGEEKPAVEEKYAFGLENNVSVFRQLDSLAEMRNEIVKLHDNMSAEEIEKIDWGTALTDSFFYDKDKHVTDYVTENKFYFPYYDDDKNLTGISELSSEFYYDLSESSEDVLSRLFDYSSEESMSDLESRLKTEKPYLFKNENSNKSNSYEDIILDVFGHTVTYYKDFDKIHNVPKGGKIKNGYYVGEVEPFYQIYQSYYATGDDVSDTYLEACKMLDSYNTLRIIYEESLVMHLADYIKSNK